MNGDTDAALARIGRRRRVVLAVPHFMGVLRAAAHGQLLAVVPRSFAEAFAPQLGLAVFTPPIPMPTPKIQMYWHSRHDQSPAHRWLRTLVADGFRGMA
jgi:DNA-binding transcriptional LysR family regulator